MISYLSSAIIEHTTDGDNDTIIFVENLDCLTVGRRDAQKLLDDTDELRRLQRDSHS